MMDATAMYPLGFHPVHDISLPDGHTRAPFLSRLEAPVRYYFVDFGLAVSIPPEVYPKRALGAYGLDREAPELSFTKEYDPFKLDIFILGNVFQKEIYAVSIAR